MAGCSFEDLEIWQRSSRLAVRLYEVLSGCRDFALKEQMTRAAVSIASMIQGLINTLRKKRKKALL
jgi:four helix bundle protein